MEFTKEELVALLGALKVVENEGWRLSPMELRLVKKIETELRK